MSPQPHGDDPLSRVVEHLNEGDFKRAIASLEAILKTEPDHPVALTLLGIALLELSDFGEAEKHLRRALRLSPGHPGIFVNLAKAVRQSGRPDEAIDLSRSALALAPHDDEALAELAAAHLARGDFDQATALTHRLVERNPTSPDARRALAASLVAADRSAEAEQVLRDALALAPPEASTSTTAILHHDLGTILRRRREFDGALAEYDVAMRDGVSSRLHTDRAIALQHLHRFDDAIAALHAAVAADPLDMGAHLQLNELLFRQDRHEEFLKSYDAAAALVQDDPLPLLGKGQALLKIGRARDSVTYFDRALARSPSNLAASAGKTCALEQVGEIEAAGLILDRMLAANGRHPAALIVAGSFFLRRQDPERTIAIADRVRAIEPFNQEALALLSLAYRAIGDDREEELAGYDRLVRIVDLPSPADWRSDASFHEALAAYLGGLHGDKREHFTQTLHGGTRAYGEIFRNGHAIVDALRPAIDQAVAEYVRDLSVLAPPPFRDRIGRGFRYVSSWSSQLSTNGFHENHIHPEGWISAVYYAAVPDACADPIERQGWLKFGEPSSDFGPNYLPRRLIEPRPGRLVLFPSYLWHGTTPLLSHQARMTIAFDVAPV